MPTVDIPAPGGSIPAYLSLPPEVDPAPGILVLLDPGCTPKECKAYADRFAGSGFLALSADPAQRNGMQYCLREFAHDLIHGSGPSFANLQACCTWLGSQPGCTGRVGISGVCIAGGFAMLLALDHDGGGPGIGSGEGIPEEVENFLDNECPFAGSGGSRAALNLVVARELEQSLQKALAFLHSQNQPEAELMFMNDRRVFWFKLLRLPGSGEGAAEAQDFHRNLAAFFTHHLAPD